VTTVAEAVAQGSSLLVLGRAVTSALDPRAALEAARTSVPKPAPPGRLDVLAKGCPAMVCG